MTEQSRLTDTAGPVRHGGVRRLSAAGGALRFGLRTRRVRLRLHVLLGMGLAALVVWPGVIWASPVRAQEPAPTATLTAAAPLGMYITVTTSEPQVNVRLGPSSAIFPIVGALPQGATAPALGRSAGGDWIQIEFPGAPGNKGWVYSPLVTLSPGVLPVVESPPTPIPPPTSTIDPTLAAQFNTGPTPTRLATFTPPPALTRPVYEDDAGSASRPPLALGAVIMVLSFLGAGGLLVSVLTRR